MGEHRGAGPRLRLIAIDGMSVDQRGVLEPIVGQVEKLEVLRQRRAVRLARAELRRLSTGRARARWTPRPGR
jgi:hypothetical protein